ncbi:alanine racemase [Paenibacillus sp. MBLB4367]|uniref:alanine racemase n=1 Tax=Paenibacillus sp. MBLB4367 TaxID=3384767 RepID=UPI003908023C
MHIAESLNRAVKGQPESRHRHTWADISPEAIRHNVRAFQALLSERSLLMAVVKADGYGHGAVQTAAAALQAGAGYLGVAFADEAFELRRAGITAPILILGYTAPEFAAAAVEHDVTVTVFTRESLQAVIGHAERSGKQARVHLKIDTGMTRLGVSAPQEALELAAIAAGSPHAELEGVFTHFAEADRAASRFTEEQFASFMKIVRHLETNGIRIPLVHCCNTAGTIHFPHMHMDMVRIGIGLYGVNPCAERPVVAVNLKKAMHLRTKIAALTWIPAGQSVSYGRTYRAERETLIAVLPVGYADGLPRSLSNIGSVLVKGRRAPIVGTICMDQMMADVTDVPKLAAGDEVVLFGDEVPVEEIAALTGTIGYEVLCGISKRVPRVYGEADRDRA